MNADLVFTIGHSKHPIGTFIELLYEHGVSSVADVRSQPYSKFNPDFNREPLLRTLRENGITYIFLGKELGARSDDSSCYEDGKVQYRRLAATDTFRSGIRQLREHAKDHRVALVCAEREPLECHRTILIARELVDVGPLCQ